MIGRTRSINGEMSGVSEVAKTRKRHLRTLYSPDEKGWEKKTLDNCRETAVMGKFLFPVTMEAASRPRKKEKLSEKNK